MTRAVVERREMVKKSEYVRVDVLPEHRLALKSLVDRRHQKAHPEGSTFKDSLDTIREPIEVQILGIMGEYAMLTALGYEPIPMIQAEVPKLGYLLNGVRVESFGSRQPQLKVNKKRAERSDAPAGYVAVRVLTDEHGRLSMKADVIGWATPEMLLGSRLVDPNWSGMTQFYQVGAKEQRPIQSLAMFIAGGGEWI